MNLESTGDRRRGDSMTSTTRWICDRVNKMKCVIAHGEVNPANCCGTEITGEISACVCACVATVWYLIKRVPMRGWREGLIRSEGNDGRRKRDAANRDRCSSRRIDRWVNTFVTTRECVDSRRDSLRTRDIAKRHTGRRYTHVLHSRTSDITVISPWIDLVILSWAFIENSEITVTFLLRGDMLIARIFQRSNDQ